MPSTFICPDALCVSIMRNIDLWSGCLYLAYFLWVSVKKPYSLYGWRHSLSGQNFEPKRSMEHAETGNASSHLLYWNSERIFSQNVLNEPLNVGDPILSYYICMKKIICLPDTAYLPVRPSVTGTQWPEDGLLVLINNISRWEHAIIYDGRWTSLITGEQDRST